MSLRGGTCQQPADTLLGYEVTDLNKRNFTSSLIVLAFFVFFYFQAVQLKAGASYWPKLICVVGGVLSAVNAAIAGVQWARTREDGRVFPFSPAQFKNFLILLAISVVWIFLTPRLGYLVTSVLATGAIVLAFEPARDRRHIIRDVIVTLIFAAMIYGLFSLLGIHFPKGLLI